MLFWTKEEYQRFAEEMMDKPISYYAFQMLYWTGIREGELLALTPADFDFDRGTVKISKTYQRLKGKDVITSPKTKKSNRTIQMPDFLCEEMQEFFKMQYGLKKKDRIFTITKSYLHREMDRGAEAAGVKRIRIHDIRHSHISLLIDMGFSAVAIADRVGHESIEITYRYAHLFPSKQKEMASNPNLHVFSAHLHMDEATPHLHIDFIPFTTGSKRGLSTRVSMKQALADQGIVGEGRSMTERAVWVQQQKEALAEIMLEHGIEWEQKGEHREHLSVLEFKRKKRKEELAELEQTIDHVKQQRVDIQAVERIEAKPLPFSSKVTMERTDFEKLTAAAEKYVVQEKQENKLKKLLKEAKKTISDLKAKIELLITELSAVKAELAQYKSVRGKLRTADLEKENERLRSRIKTYDEVISRNNLWHFFRGSRDKNHNRVEAR